METISSRINGDTGASSQDKPSFLAKEPVRPNELGPKIDVQQLSRNGALKQVSELLRQCNIRDVGTMDILEKTGGRVPDDAAELEAIASVVRYTES